MTDAHIRHVRLIARPAVIALLAFPRTALACAVCFGQSDSPMAQATNMGILLMLGVVAVVLASFGSFFIYLNRRARLASLESDRSADSPADAGRNVLGTDPQEGTARC
jgi:hypothetical protein